ncbi:hypothetical protein BJ322DRAFT_76670 [Thelephora terrestris]|uniref:Uncharacterized protein n=1 Tax=Thelephora terrestris TaxID=56493 RepID=A0A9P6HQW2_9AGAM|nr:hypothetical protein BJ322DRAFT_76670 [Thelephora terrestris]
MSGNHETTPRKPSSSSSQSLGPSPSGSPNNTQRKLGHHMLLGVAPNPGLKGFNSGWQVWPNSNATSKRNASISSAASVTDRSPSQKDSAYQSWNSRNGTSWDDSKESHSMTLHPGRQRPSFGPARTDRLPFLFSG